MKSTSPKPVVQEEVKEEEPVLVNPKDINPYTPEVEERFQNPRGNFNYPKTNEYPTFEGKPDEDWVNFIDIIDTLQSSYNLPDAEITSRLPSILLGVARVWFRVTCRAHRGASWARWKELIQDKFNTPLWRMKQLSLLEKDKFSYSNKETLDYLLTMRGGFRLFTLGVV